MLQFNSFLKEIESLQPDSASKTYLLATSGGADSMVMLNLFFKAQFTFQVAHINYKLREEASDLDQKLVEDYCKIHKIPLHIHQVSEDDNQPKNSIQNWARKLRYRYFKKIQQQENLEFLVTAHHLNDDLETFLINLSRGSGLKGLSGIPANKNNILRPLLHFSKEEIYQYAAVNEVPFREDASNKKSDYLRNKIRNEIVPKLEETNEHFLKNFRKSLDYLQQNKAFVKNKIAQIEEQLLIDESADKMVYDKEFFDQQDDFVKFEILRKFGFDEPLEIQKIFLAETGKSFYSKKYQLHINRNELIISKNKSETDEVAEIIIVEKFKNEDSKSIDLGKIILENTSSKAAINQLTNEQDRNTWQFDAENLVVPIKIRHRKEGDLFYPINMFGKKKVSKYFKDEKFSILDKQEIWLLVDGNDEVLGIIPHRQDKRFAANKKTEKFITFIF